MLLIPKSFPVNAMNTRIKEITESVIAKANEGVFSFLYALLLIPLIAPKLVTK